MTKSTEIRVPADKITVANRTQASVAVVGTPNCGKSTLFNRLTGLKQRIGNYPGVTVERHVGYLRTADGAIELVDLPGTHSLSAHSFEEQISVDVIFGRMEGTRKPDGILAVLDAMNLYQGLFLVQQLIELELPTVVALTMTDAAQTSGIDVDAAELGAMLGVPVYPVVATTGAGIDKLRNALVAIEGLTPPRHVHIWPELTGAAEGLAGCEKAGGVTAQQRPALAPDHPAQIEDVFFQGDQVGVAAVEQRLDVAMRAPEVLLEAGRADRLVEVQGAT